MTVVAADGAALVGVELAQKGDLALGHPQQVGLLTGRHHGHLDALAEALAPHHGHARGSGTLAERRGRPDPGRTGGHLDQHDDDDQADHHLDEQGRGRDALGPGRPDLSAA